jgi:hypothetical protein
MGYQLTKKREECPRIADSWLVPLRRSNRVLGSVLSCGTQCRAECRAAMPPSPMRPGDWICAECNNHNYADKINCNRRVAEPALSCGVGQI